MPRVPLVEQKTGTRPLPAGNIGTQLDLPRLNLPTPRGDQGVSSVGQARVNLAKSYQDIANLFTDIAVEQKKKADRTVIQEKEQRLNEWMLENLDGKTLQRQGRNAIGSATDYGANLDIFANELRGELTNDTQRSAFDAIVKDKAFSSMRTALKHERQQGNLYRKEQAEATQKSYEDLALRNVGDPRRYPAAVKSAVDSYRSYAISAGIPDEVVDQKTKQIEEDIHYKASVQMAQQDPEAFLESMGNTRSIGNTQITANASRGIRNNNPGNLRGKHKWRGKSGEDSGGYAQFESPQAGLRAMMKNLVNQQKMHGFTSVEDIITKWAPPNENDTVSYINAVSDAVGVGPADEINLQDPDTLKKFSLAIIQHENGQQPYPPEMLDAVSKDVLGMEKIDVMGDHKGMVERGNINLNKRPRVQNEDGTISTVESISVNMDGKEYLIPTISDRGKRMSEEEAIANFQKTGKHLGAFATAEDATTYAKALSSAEGDIHEKPQRVVSGVPSYDKLSWENQQKVFEEATRISDRNERKREKQLKASQEVTNFEIYSKITDPKQREGINRQVIIDMVNREEISGKQGRSLINLLESDEARDDDLAVYAELRRQEAAGLLTADQVIDAHASGNLKTSTARVMINAMTSNLSTNEAYRANEQRIKAEFDRSEFGVTDPDSASKEAEALREYQRRASNPTDGENIDGIADSIIDRLRKTASSDRAYQRNLASIRREHGTKTNDVKSIEETATKITEAMNAGRITTAEANEKLKVLQRRVEELEMQ